MGRKNWLPCFSIFSKRGVALTITNLDCGFSACINRNVASPKTRIQLIDNVTHSASFRPAEALRPDGVPASVCDEAGLDGEVSGSGFCELESFISEVFKR